MTDAPKEELTDEIIDGRRGVYGDPEETFQAKADMWTVLFRHQLKPGARITKEQVALAMILFKTVRANETPDYSDNPDDIVGYADIFRLVQGEDFIQARNVGDYLEKKSARDSAKEQSYLRDDQKLVADSLAQNRQRNL